MMTPKEAFIKMVSKAKSLGKKISYAVFERGGINDESLKKGVNQVKELQRQKLPPETMRMLTEQVIKKLKMNK